MAKYTQDKRPMKVDTVLGADVLLLDGFAGDEGVSTPFLYTLDLLSEDASIDAKKLLRTAAVVTLHLAGTTPRYIHGLITRFVQLGRTEDKLTAYRAEVAPWLWFLSLSSECKIFQNLSVLDIVEKIFKAHGFNDFQIKCTKSYPKREFCVQYRETHFNFVSRLMEEEGIFYFFDHTKDKHLLTLADANSAVKPCPGQAAARMATQSGAWQDEDVVTALEREHTVQTGKITLRDHDYLQPTLQLESSVSGDGKAEAYEYPGNYLKPDEGDRYARLRLEEHEAWRQVVRGTSTCRTFESGFRFDLKEHYRSDANQTYMLLRVQHSGHAGGYHSGGLGAAEYHNSFVAIPHSVPFRAAPTSRKPFIGGSQTAVVVGKSGEEIWVDKHGRVKVQFHWDRDGKKDENSSCWVRVSSAWAGKNWGVVHIPRIGQEVIVDFLEGDPDRPIITGRVYNADQAPPYTLPGDQTQSGIKSRSSKSGGTDNFNEIRFEDKKGSEVLFIHAEKDEQVEVENDRSESVGHDETVKIGNDQSEDVGNNKQVKVGKDQSITVGANQDESIGKNMTLSVKENCDATIGKDLTEDISGGMSLKVGKDSAVNVGNSHGLEVGKQITIKAGDSITIESDKEVLIKTGDASIHMKKSGDIVIKGGKIQVKASDDLVLKGSKIAAN